jgi:hypothetical protein
VVARVAGNLAKRITFAEDYSLTEGSQGGLP